MSEEDGWLGPCLGASMEGEQEGVDIGACCHVIELPRYERVAHRTDKPLTAILTPSIFPCASWKAPISVLRFA